MISARNRPGSSINTDKWADHFIRKSDSTLRRFGFPGIHAKPERVGVVLGGALGFQK
jgi:hypothetical protein